MTDREIVVRRLKRLIKAAHNDMSDFVFVTVGTANVIIRLLEEQERVRLFVDESGKITPLNTPTFIRCKDCEHIYFASNRVPDERSYACGKHGIDIVPEWFCADGERRDTE